MSARIPLFAQRVRVTWTKASRGMPGAALRAAVPFAFALPPTFLSSSRASARVHVVVADEADDFVPRTADAASGDDDFALIDQRFFDDAVEVRFRDDHWSYGGPSQLGVHGALFRLARGEVGSFVFNRRTAYSLSGRRASSYREERWHFCAGKPADVDVFVTAARVKTVDVRVRLF